MSEQTDKKEEILKHWEAKAKEVYKDSVKLMREGFHGLEVMAGKTVEVTRIKIANQKALSQIRSLFVDLGQRVYHAVVHQKNNVINLSSDMSGFIDKINKLQKTVEANLKKLTHITIVQNSSVPKSSQSKKKAPAKKQEKK